MKKLYIALSILFIMALGAKVESAWAFSPTAAAERIVQETTRLQEQPTLAAARQATELSKIQQRADSMIASRLTSLNTLLTRVQNDSRLSSDDKTALTSSINTMIANLQALKTKIDADTDVATARADTKTIVTTYHVFATFEPQTRLLVIIANLMTTTANIQNLVPLLQNLSATLKNEGKDTTSIDAAIADMNTQLTTISSILSVDKTTLGALALTNATYQATFTQIRQDLAKVRADFAAIQHDIATITGGVHKFAATAISGTPTAGVTCMPRPACLTAQFPCKIAEPINGWCPSNPTPTVTP